MRDIAVPQSGVLTLSGYGLRVVVERGHLVVEDGAGDERRKARFNRIDSGLTRIVIVGHSGTVSLDAIAWLQGVGVPLFHLGYDGRVYFVSTPASSSVAPLRRAQARAMDTELGLDISRALLTTKITRQQALLPELPDGAGAAPWLESLRRGAEEARTMPELRDCEARAARAYWRAWKRLSIPFDRADARRRPAHWRVFGTRVSPLTEPSPRRAVNPANAVLNYLYAILEAEARVAALGARLDPALGVLHTDRPHRDSLACDLMEPVRPLVDAFALSIFRERTFTTEDVFELQDGQCRLLPPFTHQLAATATLWAPEVRRIADYVARALVTKPHRSRTIVPGVPMPRSGATRTPRGRTSVVRDFEREAPGTTWSTFQQPAGEWRGTHLLRSVFAANRAWEREHGSADPSRFLETILPGLASVPLRTLVTATGLSKTACGAIRSGKKLPHPRHWNTLRELSTQG